VGRVPLSRDVERVLRRIWEAEIKKLNDHLARETKPLSELLRAEVPQITTRRGYIHMVDKERLLKLASYVPRRLHGKIRIPVILMRRMDAGRGVYMVMGGFYEKLLVKNLVENLDPFREDLEVEDPLYVYTPHVTELIVKYRTIFQIGFFTEF